MPAIRDWTWTYNTSTTATSITVPRPYCMPGDLLLAVLSTDTGTQTWSCPGWTVLFSQTNTVNLAVAYKIATENEPASYTFTYTTAETANAAIFSIMDVDTTAPIANHARANMTVARQAMPQTTATRPNSLIIYCLAHVSTAVTPAILEGPVTFVYANDGSAHSDAVSWGFQASPGTTPGNVFASVTGTTYTAVLATVVINPPATGARIIPPHCAGDESVLVDPIQGTTAYRGNSAFAGNATTYWSSPLAGRTLANATVTARADYGINSYRSAGGMSGPTTENTYQGATLVLASANAVDVRGRHILVHAMPYQPIDIQTVYDAGTGKGIEVGLASSANNGIVWHVHGANTPFDIRRVPIVIHPDNVSGRIDVRGTFNPASVTVFGFFTCGFLVSSDWVWAMIWLMGVTTICGGNAERPIRIPDIHHICSYGHERISTMLQGENQIVIYQQVQIGNGGANPTYLHLENTAIEFPEIYNLQKRLTQYCGVPNGIGITYYAGPGDTIIHRNSVIYSASKYYWRFHPNSSPNATYDFSGLQVIGAGDIRLFPNLVLSGVSFIKCDRVATSGAYIRNCVFDSSTDSYGALVIASPDDCSKVSNCTFRNNAVAVRLSSTSPGTYTFERFWFEGNQTDVYVDATSGVVTINVVGGGNLDPSKVQSAGAQVVVNNLVRLTLSGLVPGSEVRVFEAGTTNELAGVESSGTTFTFEYNYVPDKKVDIVVHHLNYLYWRLEGYTLPNVDTVLPVSQQRDRQYLNP